MQRSRATKDPSREIEDQHRGMKYKEQYVQYGKHDIGTVKRLVSERLERTAAQLRFAH